MEWNQVQVWLSYSRIFQAMDPAHMDYTAFCDPGSFQKALDYSSENKTYPLRLCCFDLYPQTPAVPESIPFCQLLKIRALLKPIFFIPPIIQAFGNAGPKKSFRFPQPDELRTMFYSFLAVGAKGMIYFMYNDVGNSLLGFAGRQETAEEVNKETQLLQKLAPTLLDLSPRGKVTGWRENALLGKYSDSKNETYYIAANRFVKIGTQVKVDTTVHDILTGEKFNDVVSLGPAEGRVLKVGKPK